MTKTTAAQRARRQKAPEAAPEAAAPEYRVIETGKLQEVVNVLGGLSLEYAIPRDVDRLVRHLVSLPTFTPSPVAEPEAEPAESA